MCQTEQYVRKKAQNLLWYTMVTTLKTKERRQIRARSIVTEMKIKYAFANGDYVEVEVEDKLGKIIEDAEREAYESKDEEAQSEYKPLDPTDPDFGVISQEELDKINEEGKELAEKNGMGLAGLEDWSNNSGVPSNEYQGGTKNPDGTYTNPNLEA